MVQAVIRTPKSPQEIQSLMREMGADQKTASAMLAKAEHHLVHVRGLEDKDVGILKQAMQSRGGEAATSRDAGSGSEGAREALLMATSGQYSGVCENLAKQPYSLRELGRKLAVLIENIECPPAVWRHRGGEFELQGRTLIMGILNLTPDSFSDGGRFSSVEEAVEAAMHMEKAGADIIDIGGESTRPGSRRLSVDEELARVIPVLERLPQAIDCPVSIDTSKPGVAEAAVGAGVAIINDVTGFSEQSMRDLAVDTDVGMVVMHMQGEPQTMQENPHYDDVVLDICEYLEEGCAALALDGADETRIAMDPGIGFGKTLDHNLEILRRLAEFRSLGRPLLIGTSRKRFIGDILDCPTDERLEGTIGSVAAAALAGADIVRVHDVEQVRKALRVVDSIAAGTKVG